MATSYVYALHDFAPLNEDELSFKSGDKIEVIEKDDQYGDGWWTGKVVTGGPEDKDALVGLFPGSYTTSEPPPAKPAAVTTAGTSISTDAATNGNSTVPSIQVTASSTAMQETLTDVQQAIEQLAHKSSNPSFSFASNSNIDSDARSFSTSSEREPDSTTDGEDEEVDIPKSAQAGLPGGFSHNSARRRLAEKARRAVEEAEKLETMLLSEEVLRRRMMPVDVEISDESEGEDDHHHHQFGDEDAGDTLKHPLEAVINARRHSRIPEETEEEDNISLSIPKPDPAEEEEDVKTATLTSKFPEPQILTAPSSSPSPIPTPIAIPRSIKASSPVPTSPLARETPSPEPPVVQQPLASNGLTNGGKEVDSDDKEDDKEADPNSHTSSPPSSWTVQQVISWLKSKGFGADVCEKFIEQEITGDVLLALDINLLKTEIGIVAFGKRMRIANAITDLRRPPSIQYSDGTGPPHSPGVMSSPGFGYPSQIGGGHSRSQSLVPSHHSFPGVSAISNTLQEPSTPGHANLSHSISQSLSDSGRDASQTTTQTTLTSSSGDRGGGIDDRAVLSETETATTKKNATAQSVRRRLFGRSHDSSNSIGTGKDSRRNSGQSTNPPSSPLPSGMTETTVATTVVAADDDEKEPPSPLPSDQPIKTTGTGARHKGKKSLETSTSAPLPTSSSKPDRLSIFGTSFGPSRNRKPVPRYSALSDDTQLLDHKESRSSSFHLPKLGSSGSKKANGRPGTSDGSSLSSKGEPGVLRKRTSSHPGKAEAGGGLTASVSEPPLSVSNKLAALDPTPNGSSGIKDVSKDNNKSREKPALDLSNPDFAGYLRKKGERYNTWKMRYLVLKGIDLWVMKSDKWNPDTKPKGYINLLGYKVSTLSQNSSTPANSYSFTLTHPYDSPHYFSSTSSTTTREWMKAIMKASISRDYTRPVISSCNIPTIPLVVAQAMNPAPRPPSPGQRERTQRMFLQKRERELGVQNGDGGQSNGTGVGRLSSRDARVLMGMPTSPNGVDDGGADVEGRVKLDEVFARENVRAVANSDDAIRNSSSTVTPPRPSREGRRVSSTGVIQ